VRATLLSHFRNEEYLLPWWVNHHKDHFDQAILIDYHSTDRSREIIRELAPSGWKVVTSANQFFSASRVDQEIMQVEASFGGAKIVLNTTEFLVGDLSGAIKAIGECGAIRPWGATLVDTEPEQEPSYALPLLSQKYMAVASFHRAAKDLEIPDISRPLDFAAAFMDNPVDAFRGFSNRRFCQIWNPDKRRRILHSYPHGQYSAGRHSTGIPNVDHTENLGVVWLAASPWTEAFIGRKNSIKDSIPVEDKLGGAGIQHFFDDKQINALYKFYRRRAVALNHTTIF
jgi:hypothetical protein